MLARVTSERVRTAPGASRREGASVGGRRLTRATAGATATSARLRRTAGALGARGVTARATLARATRGLTFAAATTGAPASSPRSAALVVTARTTLAALMRVASPRLSKIFDALGVEALAGARRLGPVSYTHLTLPTILLV